MNNPPGAVTGEKLSWIKGAKVFIVFLPHTEKNCPDYFQFLFTTVLWAQSSELPGRGHLGASA